MESLDKLVLFLGCIMEVVMLFEYFEVFSEIRIRRKYFAFCNIGTAVIIWMIRIYGNVTMNMIFVPIVLWLSVSAVFEVVYRIKCGHYIIVYTAIFDMELLFEILSETKADTLPEIGMVKVSDYPWELFLITVLNYFLFLIMKQLSKKFPLKEKNKEITKYMYILPAILGTFILVLCLGININDSFISKTVTIVFFVCMLVGNMIYFYGLQIHIEILDKIHAQGTQIACYKSEIEHLSQVSELNAEISETLHNTSHYLKMIRELAHQNRNQELCEMVDEFCGKLKRENIYEYSQNELLNTILSEYGERAKKNGVIFDVYVEPGCVLEQVQDIDLITMMGNLLDNAVLAATEKGGNSSVILRIFMQKAGKLCVIKVVNDFTGERKEKNGRLLSTKKEPGIHGIGMKSVSNTAKKYDGYLEHYVEDGKFCVVLILPRHRELDRNER